MQEGTRPSRPLPRVLLCVAAAAVLVAGLLFSVVAAGQEKETRIDASKSHGKKPQEGGLPDPPIPGEAFLGSNLQAEPKATGEKTGGGGEEEDAFHSATSSPPYHTGKSRTRYIGSSSGADKWDETDKNDKSLMWKPELSIHDSAINIKPGFYTQCRIPSELMEPPASKDPYSPEFHSSDVRSTFEGLSDGYQESLSPSAEVEVSCSPMDQIVCITVKDSISISTFNPVRLWRQGWKWRKGMKDVSEYKLNINRPSECSAEASPFPEFSLRHNKEGRIVSIQMKGSWARKYKFDVSKISECPLPRAIRIRHLYHHRPIVVDTAGILRYVGHCLFRVVLPSLEGLVASRYVLEAETTIRGKKRVFEMKFPRAESELNTGFRDPGDYPFDTSCLVRNPNLDIQLWTAWGRYVVRNPLPENGGPEDIWRKEIVKDGVVLYIFTGKHEPNPYDNDRIYYRKI